ncbi:hypothetical protein BMH32_11000 [Leucobacter sp. OLJS4]|nr:hypothetical protein BMH25_14190 [Leucobacter sp. OLCALW19]PII86328.1 hypothetical protein BMH26_14625 [Leucobacter sp. OLTLW20]PII90223.1 hypothetical protein BMH27_12790 [Leucobacter sp. OLAS13]PII97256.1 hypothetical protein BMH29_13475 [Leucobacter sp. OLDS2]PIJ01161.1 hypothetical protein BMH28_07405 [Leucobacter sp. OLCS4]PIJ02050.1 hypothetical protein BMH31_11405 [Leucobacter sp. OLIS6]PIJ08358.1 hypothetical protein BMH32_11000 [Leucobacter sp. OLJS4]PIJ47899.1 hypothetical prote
MEEPVNTFPLTETDRAILSELAADGRLPYTELAARVGMPVSTCHGRVRALEAAGVIRGYRADIDPEVTGSSVNALILLRVLSHERDGIPVLAEQLRRVPGVQQVYLIGGDRDFVLHVACASVPALRDLIAQHIGSNPALAQSQTQIVFDHFRGLSPV